MVDRPSRPPHRARPRGISSRLVKVIVPPRRRVLTLDALVRVMTDRMAQRWGQLVVIENISGGGGNIGVDRFARLRPMATR